MKLLRLELFSRYKSIESFRYDFRTPDDANIDFSPICFVGLNGSGKSNIIEALSEIFCYLDLNILNYENTPKWTQKSPFKFEIEYTLIFEYNIEKHIKVTCEKGKYPSCFILDNNGVFQEEELSKNLLPSKIIGYSSGHNESISYPYLKNQGFYANEVGKIALTDPFKKGLHHTLSLFMDYDINSLILITNYLFNKDTSAFRELIRIEQPTSFEININLSQGSKRDIELTSELKDVVIKLQKAAIFSDGDFEKVWKLNFLINGALKKAVQTLFKNAEDFFSSLYKLSLLNSLRLTKSERNFYTREIKEDSLKERPPSVPKEHKVFYIDELKIQLNAPNIEIDYAGLSDGEHQFIHIFGMIMLFNEQNCLFLLDEPESHFNPQWRSQFIYLVNNIVKENNPEFILSTHSPYVISAAKREHVLKFYREESVIKYKEPTRETFGATFEEILTELFDIPNSISAYSESYIKELIKNQNLEEMEFAISNIANSSVKRFLYQEILRLRKK